jgi:uncharacterized LabA/DUF88 family protein
MAVSTRVFVDYWNFQLRWNERSSGRQCDWPKLPAVLAAGAQACAPQLGQLQIDDTRIYASWNPEKEAKLRRWLDSFLDRQPGFRVFTRERKSRPTPVYCKSCKTEMSACPECKVPYVRAVEKGTDAAIVTDMFSLAWEKAYDVAILVSGDADLVPAVEKIQDRGLKIVNATWDKYGHHLAKACWASFPIDSLITQLSRT